MIFDMGAPIHFKGCLPSGPNQKAVNRFTLIKMLLVEKLLRLYQRAKVANKSTEVEEVESIESLINPDLLARLKDAERHEYILTGYQWRARSISSKNEGHWGNWSLCNEETYNDYKNRPFRGGWQFEAYAVYVKLLSSDPFFENCTVENTKPRKITTAHDGCGF